MLQSRWARIAGQVALWLVTLLIALTMFDAGVGKFKNATGWQHWFVEVWGYPGWFRVFIGVGEIVGAVLLLWPRLASYAASGLIVIMLGAFVTVTTMPTDLSWFDPLFNATLLGIVLAGRWSARYRVPIRPSQSE